MCTLILYFIALYGFSGTCFASPINLTEGIIRQRGTEFIKLILKGR